jgi:putative flippase GtrA
MPSFIIRWLFRNSPRRQQLATQFAKYMAGGSLYFWCGYAIFAICYSGLRWYWLWAKMAADAIGWSLNYLVQRYWAFAAAVSGSVSDSSAIAPDTKPDTATSHARPRLSEIQHLGRYLFIESIGFILDYAIIAGLRLLGVTPYIGFFISAAFFTIWSYLCYKYWVFPEIRSKPATGSSTP